MTSRKRMLQSLNHRGGPVPIDFGSTAITGMHCSNVAALRDHYGLEKRPVKVHEPYQMLGLMEDDLLDAIGVDTVGMEPLSNIFGFPSNDWKPWTAPWGQELLVPGKFNVVQNDKGTYIYPQGDTEAPFSGHMPTTGFFFDAIIRQPEIDDDNLNPEDNLEEFNPLTDEELGRLKLYAKTAEASGRCVIGGGPGTALGDIALVPAPFLKEPKGIRDITEWYISTAIRQDYIHEVFTRQTKLALANLEKMWASVGELMDVIVICGTDFGTQTGSFCSPETYDELWHPYYQQMNDWIHANTTWKTFKHCCGAVENFMDRFIASGFDIINPVQCSATGMDPQVLKDRYGDRITFWGGGVDTQHVLPFGTPGEVRAQVLERCEIFSQNGGFVFDAIHNVQANTPVENMVAMINAVHEFNEN
ncbi:uroporphyrinogen decarboxylase family protein [Pontiellaceae bacterium B12227]|nr:uroporphyrinogen decarboxylase family protein [Pontiellaceae bacterium B12227]